MEDLLLGRIDFQSRRGQVVRLGDVRSDFPQAFNETPWAVSKIRVVKARTRVTEGFSNGALVLDHAARVGEAVQVDLGLPKGLECLNAHIFYGDPIPGSYHIATTQLGAMQVTTEQGLPASKAEIDFGYTNAEQIMKSYYGDRAFACMENFHSRWELLEVTQPLGDSMYNYPLVICDPATINEKDIYPYQPTSFHHNAILDYHHSQRWMAFSGQKYFELVVRKLAISNDTDFRPVPLLSTNVTGDLLVDPEHRITLRYAAWFK